MASNLALTIALALAAGLAGCRHTAPPPGELPEPFEISLHARRGEDASRYFELSRDRELSFGEHLGGRYAVGRPIGSVTDAQALELWTLIRDRELLDASGRAFVVGWDSVRFDVRIRAGDEAHHIVARDADLPALADLERALSLIRTEISLRGLHEAAADSS